MITLASYFGLYALGMASMRLLDYLLSRRRAARITKRILEG